MRSMVLQTCTCNGMCCRVQIKSNQRFKFGVAAEEVRGMPPCSQCSIDVYPHVEVLIESEDFFEEHRDMGRFRVFEVEGRRER